jgi:uncharacterized RDD family membrane protein YckC
MFCSSCGATVKEGAAFCGSCGRPVAGSSPAWPSPGAVASGVSGGAAGTVPIVQAGIGATRDTGLYAGFWLRVVAAIIDTLLLAIPYVFVAFVIFATAIPMIRGLGQEPNPFLLFSLLASRALLFAAFSLLMSWLYWSLLESSSWQATVGKKALGLYVTDLAGARLSFGKASGRFFAGRGIGHVPSIGGLYFLIDCICAGFTDKKQAVHDIIAGCLVRRNA